MEIQSMKAHNSNQVRLSLDFDVVHIDPYDKLLNMVKNGDDKKS
jgi:hypothetical protein